MKTKFSTCALPNSLHEQDADDIAARHGLTLDEMRADFNQANEYGRQICSGCFSTGNAVEEAAMRAEHAGRYNDAAYLFESYCAQASFESRADSRAYARYEEAAFGGPHGQSL